jgi:hypothetical protein
MAMRIGKGGGCARGIQACTRSDQQAWGGFLLAVWAGAILAIYVLSLRPSIAWNDTPEFVDVAYTLGIAHPPGSPTYALLAKISTILPLGAMAARVNLFSTICALAALVLLLRCILLLQEYLQTSGRAAWLGGLLAVTLLAVAPTWWAYATRSEVYAPFVLVVAVLFHLALKWEQTGDERYALAGAFVFGVSGGIHGTAIFFAPALTYLLVSRTPRQRLAGLMLRAAAFAILGVSVYLYLPIRAGTEPSFNWGHPDSWARFWSHVSDRKDAQYHFPIMSKPWLPYLRMFALNLHRELTVVGWVFASIGLGVLLARSRRLVIFTIAFCLGNLLFFIQIWTVPDAYLPTFFCVAFWAGMGLGWLLDRKGPLGRVAVVGACAASMIAVAVQMKDSAALARVRMTDAARSAVQENLLPLPLNAMVLVTANWFPMRYLQDVEGERPDVSIILVSDLTVPRHFTPVTAQRFPHVAVPSRDRNVERWDRFFRQLLDENLGRVPVYWEPLPELDRNVYPYLLPWRYLWRFNPAGRHKASREEIETYFRDLRGFLEGELQQPGVLEETDAVRYHAYLLTASAEVLKLQGRPQDALTIVELAGRLTPDNPGVANELGRFYSGFRRWDDAERAFDRAAALTPGEVIALVNKAILQISLNRMEEARTTIARAIAVNPRAPEPYYQLSVLERKVGRPVAAKAALEQALARTHDQRLLRAWRSELDRIETEPRT